MSTSKSDALAQYLWSYSVSWCLIEGYGHGDRHCPVGACGSKKDIF